MLFEALFTAGIVNLLIDRVAVLGTEEPRR